MDGDKMYLRERNHLEKDKKYITDEQQQQQLNTGRSGVSSYEHRFQEYNSEHLLQFKSGRPMQSFSELQSLTIEPQAHGLDDDYDEDIELDDNGQNVAVKKQMLEQFYKFDCFLLKNRSKIEGSISSSSENQQSLMNKGGTMSTSFQEDLTFNQLKSNKNQQQQMQQQQIQLNYVPAFPTLKEMKIDFDKVANHFPSDRLEEVLKQNQQDISNNKLNNNDQMINNLTVTEPSSILNNKSNNNNNNNSQVNNYQLQQLTALRRTSKDITLNNNTINFAGYVNQYNSTKHFESNMQNISNNSNAFQTHLMVGQKNKYNPLKNHQNRGQKKRAITLAFTDNVQELMDVDRNILDSEDINKKRTVQEIILKLSIRSSLMVYKFIRSLKKRVNFMGIEELTLPQLELLNDLAFFSNSNSQNHSKKRYPRSCLTHVLTNKLQNVSKFFVGISSYCLSCIADLEPIDPTTNKMVIWLILQFLFIVAALFYTPLEIINGSTYDEKYGKTWVYFKFCNMLVFFADILLKFNTGLFEKGQIVMNRKEIVKAYFEGSFFFDVVALIPVTQTLLQVEYLRPINILILLKVITATKILSQLQEMISQRNSQLQNTISLLQLLLMICSICHIFACVFIGIAVVEDKYQLTKTNWMEKNEIFGDNIHWFSKYISSLYFAVTTMITVGYGDIVPVTTYEIFFVTIAMFVSCGVFAYSFNQIGDLVREQNRMSNEFKREMVLVNRLLEKKKINRDLQIQVRKFLEFRFYAEPQLSMEEEQAVMSKLSHHLREKVILESNFQIINQCTLLNRNFSQKFLETLALKMTEIRVSKNEIIFEKDDEDDDPMLYIINKGTIEIFVETDKGENEITLIQTLDQGKYFGELNFFKNSPHDACARAGDFTILYGISRSVFLQTVEDFPLDFERFCFMKDNVAYGNKITSLNLSCNVCKREDHLGIVCPKIHYIADKEKVILKDNFSMKQQRIKQKRRSSSISSSLANLQESGFHKKTKNNSLQLMSDINYMQKFFMNQDENFIFISANYPEFTENCDITTIDEGTQDQIQNVSTPGNQQFGSISGFLNNGQQKQFLQQQQQQVPSIQQISGTDFKKYMLTSRDQQQFDGVLTHTSQIYGQKITEQTKVESDIESPKMQGKFSPKYSPKLIARPSQLQIANAQNNNNNNNSPSSGNLKQRQTTFFPVPPLQSVPSIFNGQNNIGGTNLGSPGSPKNGGITNTRDMFGMLNSKKKSTIVKRFTNNLHTTEYIHSQQQLQMQQQQQQGAQLSPIQGQQLQQQQNTEEEIGGYQPGYQFSNAIQHYPMINTNQQQQQQQQIQMLIQMLMKQLNNGNYGGGSNLLGTQNNISIMNNLKGTPQSIRNTSVRRATRMASTNNKRKEKEQLLAQVQNSNLGEQQYLVDGCQDLDLSGFFEKMKNYQVFFPQSNVNCVMKSLETFCDSQPSYFGVYSFTIRQQKQQQKQQQIHQQKDDQQLFNGQFGIMAGNGFGGVSPSVRTKNSKAMNASVMGNSTLTLNPNGNQNTFAKHKGSLMSGITKGISSVDNSKKQYNQRQSIFSSNNNNQMKSASFRGDSFFVGLNNQNSIESKQMMLRNNLVNGYNNQDSIVSLPQQRIIVHNKYPQFIFKKLITLS